VLHRRLHRVRNSSTGVPMVTMTGPLRVIASGADVKTSRLFASALASKGAAPCSMNGSLPDPQRRQHRLVAVVTLTVSPASVKASTSGMPT